MRAPALAAQPGEREGERQGRRASRIHARRRRLALFFLALTPRLFPPTHSSLHPPQRLGSGQADASQTLPSPGGGPAPAPGGGVRVRRSVGRRHDARQMGDQKLGGLGRGGAGVGKVNGARSMSGDKTGYLCVRARGGLAQARPASRRHYKHQSAPPALSSNSSSIKNTASPPSAPLPAQPWPPPASPPSAPRKPSARPTSRPSPRPTWPGRPAPATSRRPRPRRGWTPLLPRRTPCPVPLPPWSCSTASPSPPCARA